MLTYVVVVLCALALPASAAAAAAIMPTIQPSADANQTTITWSTSQAATTELVWDSERHATFDGFGTRPTHTLSSSQLSTQHSRTISFLPAGTYYYAVRSSAAGNVVAESAVGTFVVKAEAEGSLKRIVLTADGKTSTKITATVTPADAKSITYIAGTFRRVGVRTGQGVVMDLAQSKLQTGAPMFNGDVNVAINDTRGGWFVGGAFTQVGGLTRNGLVHILPDGGVDPSFNTGTGFGNPGSATGVVKTLALDTVNTPAAGHGYRLYVGGGFATYGSPGARSVTTVNNLVALDSSSGAIDTGFDISNGPNIGADRPVYTIVVDKRPLTTAGRTDDYADYSGVYVGGAFNYIGGMQFDRVAKLELNGHRSKWRKAIPIDASIEWSIIKSLVGEDAFKPMGQFESCGISQRMDCPKLADDSKAGTIRLPAPVTDVNAIDERNSANKIVTSMATYNQNKPDPTSTTTPRKTCVESGLTPPKEPQSMTDLKNVPVLGYVLAFGNMITAVLMPHSDAHKYMSDFAYNSISSMYDETLILGGHFDSVRTYQDTTLGSTSVRANITGLDAATGTAQLDDKNNPGLASLEQVFPDLGERVRNDVANNNYRFHNVDLRGMITSLVVDDDDMSSCHHDKLFVGGDFVNIPKTGDTATQADFATVNLDPAYGHEWNVVADQSASAMQVTDKLTADEVHNLQSQPLLVTPRVQDGRAVGAMQLVGDRVTVAGNYVLQGQDVNRTAVTSFSTRDGSKLEDDPGVRDGVDGSVRALAVNGSGEKARAFIGGEFTTYDSYLRPGIAALRTPDGETGGQIDVDTQFAPHDGVTGDVTSMASTPTQVALGGDFGLAAYHRTDGALDRNVSANGAFVGGGVKALYAMGDDLVVGGAFSSYAHTGPYDFNCECAHVAVIDDVLGLPVGYHAAAGGVLRGSYQYDHLGVDGTVNAIAGFGPRLYFGGSFHHYRGDSAERGGLLAVNSVDGTLDTKFHAQSGGTDGTVNDVLALDDSLVIGGAFDKYRGDAAKNVARIDRTTGDLVGVYRDAHDADQFPQPVSDVSLTNNVLFAIGDFNGVIASNVWSGSPIAVAGTDSSQPLSTLGAVGDHPLIGGDTTVTLDAAADTRPASITTSVTSKSSVHGNLYDPRGTFDVSVTAFDTGTFAEADAVDLVTGIRMISWPKIKDATVSLDPFDADAVKGLKFSCTHNDADALTGTAKVLDGSDTAGAFAAVARAGDQRKCTLTGFVVVPHDAPQAGTGHALQLRASGVGKVDATYGDPTRTEATDGATATVPVQRDEALPVTITWTGSAADVRSIKLEWYSNGDDGVTKWERVPATMLLNTITFVRTYDLRATTNTQVLNFNVHVADQSSATAPTTTTALDAQPDTEHPTLSPKFTVGNGFDKTVDGKVTLTIGAPSDNSGSADIYLYRMTAPFTTSGTQVCDTTHASPLLAYPRDPAHPDLVLNRIDPASLDGNLTFDITQDQCVQYMVVAEDFAHLTTPMDPLKTGWVYETRKNASAQAPKQTVVSGAAAEISGDLDTSGAGADTYTISRQVGQSWLPVCAKPKTQTIVECVPPNAANKWGTTIDTTALADGATKFKVEGTDRLGRTFTQTSDPIHVDNYGPALSKSQFFEDRDATAPAHVSLQVFDASLNHAPRLWFNPNFAGTFTFAGDAQDDGYGLQQPDSVQLAAGWDKSTGSFTKLPIVPGAANAFTRSFSWTKGAVAPGEITLSMAEPGGQATPTKLEVLADDVAPDAKLGVGQDVTSTTPTTGTAAMRARARSHARAYAAADAKESAPTHMITIPITAVEDGSGLAPSTYNRRVAHMVTPGTCKGIVNWSDWSKEQSLDPSQPLTDVAVESGYCYEYSVRIFDNVNNAVAEDDPVYSSSVRVGNIAAAVADPEQVVTPVVTPPVPATPPPSTKPQVIRSKDTSGAPAPTHTAPQHHTEVPISHEPAAPAPRIVREPAPKPHLLKPKVMHVVPVVHERPVAQRPPHAKPAGDDRSWIDKSVGWVKHHKVASATIGIASAHLGSTMLFGKGLGGLLHRLHLNVPFGVIRRVCVRLWARLRGKDEDDDDDLDDDLDQGDGDLNGDGDARWAHVPAAYTPAA